MENRVNISKEKIESLRILFKSYLGSEYPQLKDPGTVISDAFYPLRHDIGIDYWEIYNAP